MESSPSPLFCGAEYTRLHTIACSNKPEVSLENEEYAVAVLQHDRIASSCQSNDFLWFKVKAKHSIAKLKSAYQKKRGHVAVDFFHASRRFPDTTQMRALNHLKHNIVVFTAHEEGQNPFPSSGMAARNPLSPMNTQLRANPNPSDPASTKTPIKSEAHVLSPYTLGQIAGLGGGAVVKDEERGAAASSSIASPSRGISNAPQTIGVKTESHDQASSAVNTAQSSRDPFSQRPSHSVLIQKIIEKGSPEELDAEVRRTQLFLQHLKTPMEGMTAVNKDAVHWTQQIDELLKHRVDPPTIIGVVGNTGAGKSSVINAMLEEERLVPTNCMRACTAVVTEISWNYSEDESARYRADIVFIDHSDWEKDLRLSLNELIDGNGQVSRECTNPESEAGIAYAKIKAVYPQKTKEDLASSTVEQLMDEPGVKAVLGKTKELAKSHPDAFYRALQSYVDSKEKVTDDPKKKREKKEMEFWPLIKVVRIYTKADALSTGAKIVDLPGVHDSNAARAAVAACYMKQCTGLFIVAPINRAVDDKAAKSLLGESFKRQLKFDGTYSRITFICSKTDDISIIEASDSLGLEDEMAADWQKVDELEKQQRDLKKSVKELKESSAVYTELINDAEDSIEVWDKLKDELDDGNEVFAPSLVSKKRKRSAEPSKSCKKGKKSQATLDSDDDDFIDDDDNDEDESASGSDAEDNSEADSEKGEPLTLEVIEAKIAQFKDDKKRARHEKSEITAQVKKLSQELRISEKAQAEKEAAMSAICIAGRNQYSKGAIQQDFADGIRELDMEAAQEDDPDQFNPEDEMRDYAEVARSLPVFCVSSRAYQKLQGRLAKDNVKAPGFRSVEETEVPQLQAHCKKLTEAGRASNCRAFLTNFSQTLNSLRLWAANDGTGLNLTDAQLAAESRFLKLRLNTLERSLDGAIKDTLKQMIEALAEHIFENYDQLVEAAISEANSTVSKWHLPVNRDNRPLGGYFWATYKAIMRREGVFSNAQGPHDFNAQLIEPIIMRLASHWERVFAQRMPRVLASFTRSSKTLLTAFHKEIESRSMKAGVGTAGVQLLGHQLRNYEQIFVTLSGAMIEVVNNLQRDANREFTPVIARNLSTAYDCCTAESGPGQFKRMQAYMVNHVDRARSTMFQESCDEVRNRLLDMCKQVEQQMSLKTDEIFMKMQRDYTQVVSGTNLSQGQMMPKNERKMRVDVSQTIDNFEGEMAEAQEVAQAAKAAQEEKDALEAAQESSNVGFPGFSEERQSSADRHIQKVKSEPDTEENGGSSASPVAAGNEDVDMD